MASKKTTSGKRKDSKGRLLKQGESQRPDGTYCYRKMRNGKADKPIYAKTLDELREKVRSREKSLLYGIDLVQADKTVADFIEYVLNRPSNKRPQTLANYNSLYNSLKDYPLLSLRICEVRYVDCDNFVRELATKYAKGSVRLRVALVKQAFNEAQKQDAIYQNYMKLIRLSDTEYRFQEGKNPEALERGEQQLFLDFARDVVHSSYYWDFVCLIETGLRISELYGLTFPDIDWQTRTLKVERQLYRLDGTYHVGPPKTQCGKRRIPLSDKAIDAFRHVIQERQKVKVEVMIDGVSGFLFLNRTGYPKTANQAGDSIRLIRERYREMYGEDMPYITPHVLRHTFDSNMYHNGLDVKSLQAVMGHSTPQLTLDRYTDVDFDHIQKAFRLCSKA